MRNTLLGALMGGLVLLLDSIMGGLGAGAPNHPFLHVHDQAEAAGTCPAVSWHEPGAHGTFGAHEHGDAPPSWVVNSRWKPFSQCREGHTGYKGVLARTDNGVESYIIPHILSTHAARSHGDHDYELWVKDPTGSVSHWGFSGATNTSVLDFGTSPTQQRCAKSGGIRPSMEQDRTAAVDSEAWYTVNNFDSALVNLGYLMYGPNQQMDGTNGGPNCPPVVLGDSSRRDIGWVVSVQADQYGSPSKSLMKYCTPGEKGCLLTFARGNHDYAPGATMSFPN